MALMETVGFAGFFRDRLGRRGRGRSPCCRLLAAAATAHGHRPAGPGRDDDRVVIVGVGSVGSPLRSGSKRAATTSRLFERNEVVGGKLAVLRPGRVCTFDIGPSLITLAHVVRRRAPRMRHLARRTSSIWCASIRSSRYYWPDGSTLTVHGRRRCHASAEFEAFAPGAGDAVASVRRPRSAHLGRERANVLRRSDEQPDWSLAKRLRSPLDLSAIDPIRTLHRAAAQSFFDDPGWCSGPVATPPTPARRRSVPRHARLHPPHRVALRLLVPDGRARRAARRRWRPERHCTCHGRRAPHRCRASSPDRCRFRSTGSTGVDVRRRHVRACRRRGGQHRRRAPLPTCCPMRQALKAGAPCRAVDERVRAVRRCARGSHRASPITTCGSRRRLPRRVRPTRPPARSPTIRRSTPACRR
jgi:hypothetical protein